jgi:preprotein translocase subunit SecA
MDYLREGIGLRAMAQRDPLVEYQREGYDMFNAMMEGIKEESVGNLFNLQLEVQENPIVEEVTDDASAAAPAAGAAAGAHGAAGSAPSGAVPPSAAPPGVVPAGVVPASGQASSAPPAAFGRPPAGSRAPAQGGGRGGAPADGGQGEVAAQGGGGQGGARQGSSRQGARQGGRHASDGRGHATAAGRGQAAARSGGAHAAPAGNGPVARGLEPNRPRQLQYSAPSEGGGVEQRRGANADPFANVGRNDTCPCGSGRKYKRCHGDPRNA